jgi:peptidoglycan/LPS O-acetylase OafA/YrhL
MRTPSVSQGGRRFIAGDPLRGLACLGILFWHVIVNAAALTPPEGISAYLRAELGFLGRPLYTLSLSVWLFFALSGYLIAGPFVRAIVTGSSGRPRVLPYLRNRVLRLVPAFWAFLTLTIVIAGTEGDTLPHIAAFYGFAHVYAMGPFTDRMVQAWTLDVEAVFYIAVPLLLLPLISLLRARWTPPVRAALIVAGCALVAIASISMGERFVTSWRCVPGSAWAFTPGIALAALEPVLRPWLEGRERTRRLGWGFLAIAVAAFLSASYVVDFGSDIQENIAAFVVVGSLLTGPLLMQWATGRATRVLDNRLLNWVGKRSYGIYLAHVLVIHELHDFTASLPSMRAALVTTLPLVFIISATLGALSFRYIERPFLERRAPWRSPDRVAPGEGGVAPILQPAMRQA